MKLTPKTKPDDVEPLDLIWGVRSIGAVIGRNPQQALYLLRKGRLPPARMIGGRWCASREGLRRYFENAFAERAAE